MVNVRVMGHVLILLLISHDLCKCSKGDTLVTAVRSPAAVPRQNESDLSLTLLTQRNGIHLVNHTFIWTRKQLNIQKYLYYIICLKIGKMRQCVHSIIFDLSTNKRLPDSNFSDGIGEICYGFIKNKKSHGTGY